ncbi:hypothetical protein TAO_0338 [Candidatus Nitrosoglobus terrae]|uniref:ABC transporter domain-containing protein n=1 Tax=Candidatus Nitrosoglobus terrae TaxID=1630141 RepID=A0A1Q2SKQ7_9GAMM|nr:ATP-binding cassette domain-containing protein [Candidatus Nitrosoglobus terrae]BAW79708.1 hypothetical protein TAO_0338 [Candidatus Nitrosoglobus terrae]
MTHLSKYFGKIEAVKDLSFPIRAGSIAALLGGNGAGKTTTLAMMLGLLLPSHGDIHLLGENMLRQRWRVRYFYLLLANLSALRVVSGNR